MTDCRRGKPGRAASVSVEGEVEPPAGTEYLPDDHAIRYVAYLSPDDADPPERDSAYRTMPFERWAKTECANLGQQRVAEAVESRLDEDQSAGYAVGQHPDDGLAVKVRISTMRNRDGTVVSEPTVEYDDLRDVTPESVTATIQYAGQECTETFPVVVSELEGQYL
ncbi:hypothetical protein [Halorussus sp. MSC15.2]|uniref:hypothetical protein n=1 Tax=Halorussus sp. MSC15.2 TaxID=2283638 RepID=UPI0013D22605|nr:hypothetical protein [Halorussus sp. MSC15.2]NEU56859.1 hypothetical protein [Halorussus sp. MSC15.2]